MSQLPTRRRHGDHSRDDLVEYEAPTSAHRHPRTDAPEVIDLTGVLGAARRRWKAIAVGVVGTLAVAVLYLQVAPRKYEATASVRIDAKQSTLPTIYAEQANRDEVFTEIEELRSRTIAADVVDSTGLQVAIRSPRGVRRSDLLRAVRVLAPDDTGTFRLVRQGEGRFRVEGTTTTVAQDTPTTVHGIRFTLDSTAARHGDIEIRVAPREETIEDLREDVDIGRAGLQASMITLRYASTDPALARDVLNAWTTTFINRRQTIQRGEASSTAAFIQAQLDTLAPQLAAAEEKLLSYRDERHIIAPEVEATTQVNQSALLQATRNELDAERSALDQALKRVSARAATAPPDAPSPYRELIGFPTLLRNQAASELLHSLSLLDDQRTSLLMRRTALDPDVITLTQRIGTVEDQLKALTTTYLNGLTSQVSSADASLSSYSTRLREIPAQEVEYARLQRAPKVYAELVSLLQTRLKEAQIAEAVTDGTVRIVDYAVVPSKPSSPKPPLVLALGLVGGAVVGAGLAFARERSHQAVRSRDDLQQLSQMPVLGLIPAFATPDGGRRVSSDQKATPLLPRRFAGLLGSPSVNELAASEAFTRLLMNLEWASDEPIRSLLVTSPLPGDGKTTNTLHLAESAAFQGRRVLVIDADLRCGGLTTALGLGERRGLSEFVSGTATLEQCVTTIAPKAGSASVQLDAIGAGRLSHDVPISLLVRRLSDLLTQTRSYDFVLIDTSPINIVADAAALAPVADGVVLVARSGETSSAAIDVALDQLERADARILGTILNGAEFQRSDGYGSIGQYRAYARVEG